VNRASGIRSAGSSRTRRYDDSPPQSASPSWVEEEREASRSTKSSRNTLKKAPRRDSLHSDTSTRSQRGQAYEDGGGFVPKLSQIKEGKKSRSSRSRASSEVSSTVQPRLRRRRTADDAVAAPRSHHKRGSSRHADSLANLSNPSLVSGLSELTQESNMSHESSTTVTQTDFDAQTYVSDSEVGQGEPDTLNRVAAPDTGGPNSNVFQYMQQVPTVEEYSDGAESHDEELSTVGSSSGSSSGDSEHAGNRSSNAGSSQVTGDTPTTSPASTRRSTHEAPHAPFRKQPKSTKPLYASSFVHGDMAQEEDDASSDGSEAYSDEEGDEEDDEHEHHEESHAIDSGYAHHHALKRVAPPGVPPTSWPPSDSRASRLRQQERELANHVLQSPQPQKDFQFAGGSPSHPHPSMSMYSPRAHSGATPANFEPTAGYPSEWPPYPPPLAIAYPGQSMLESPVAGHALPLTVQPPMGVSGLPVQQHAPPFHQHLGQPPQYHAHVPASDATKTTAAGYELLANKLSETPKKGNARRKTGTVVPMYRKFEHLNHRVLLHLQDEVCELEEELRYLDDGIVQTSPRDNTTGLPFPASRRGDARYGGELHYKRTELLGRIFQKIGQYSKCHVNNFGVRPASIMS
jgi:hypothetical protein